MKFGNLGGGDENMQWGSMWDHYSLGPFEGTSVSMGCEIRKLWKGMIT